MTENPLAKLNPVTWARSDGYTLSTDRTRLDVDAVERFLCEDAYWTTGHARQTLERALAGSLVMGAYAPDATFAGFARLVTDCAIFAYMRDVFVMPDHRSKGLATWMALAIRDHPDLETVSTWMLATADAHGVYEKAGFQRAPHPEWYMTLPRNDAP